MQTISFSMLFLLSASACHAAKAKAKEFYVEGRPAVPGYEGDYVSGDEFVNPPSGYAAAFSQNDVAQPSPQESRQVNTFAQPAAQPYYQESEQTNTLYQPVYQSSQPTFAQPPAQPVYQSSQPTNIVGRAQMNAGSDQSFLGVSSGVGYATVLSTLTQAIQQQSQAMLALQRQQAHLETHEIAFEAREAQLIRDVASRLGTPKCKGFNKNKAPSVMDQATCDTACDKAEGYPASKNDYNKIKEGGSCDCLKKGDSDRRSLCTDQGARTTASMSGMFAMLLLVFVRN